MASSPSRSVTKTRSDRRSRSRPRGRGRSPARHDSLSDIEGGVNTSHDDDTGLHHTLSRTPTGPSHMGSVSSAFDTSFGSHPRRRAAPVHQLAASLPSPGLYFPQAQTQSSDSSPVVPRESDYLADWETLQRLVVPSPRRADHGPSPASASSSSSGTPRMPSLGRLGSALGRPPLPRRDTREHSPVSIRSVTSPNRLFGRPATTPIEDVPEDDSEASVSGVALSSSPGNLDFMSSISQVAETDDDSGTRTVTQTPRPQQTQLEESYERFFAPITPGVSGFPSIPGTPSQPPPPAPSGMQKLLAWRPPPYWHPIFKCSLAYLIASLFTFVPALSALLSMKTETDVHGRVRKVPAYSAHMVATIVVYFNPSKTLGNMILSTRYCFSLATLAAIVCLLSFEILRLFDYYSPSKGTNWDWVSELGDWIVCLVCVGGSMGVLAWLKLWVNNPSFNTGCSMAAVTLFTVVVKEGGWIKLKEVLFIVLIGATITNLVCFLVFPVSATSRLRTSMSKSLNSFTTLLDLLTATFLLKPPLEREHRMPLADAVKSHGAAFNSLKADLAEAKHERLIDPRIRGSNLDLYDAALGSMARLAQHLAALRGSTRLEEAILLAVKEGRISLDPAEKINPTIADSVVGDLNNLPSVTVEDREDVAQSIDLLLQLQRMTGPDLDMLVEQCDHALDSIEAVLTSSSSMKAKDVDFPRVNAGVAEALRTFSRSSSRAIKRVYAGPRRRKGVYGSDSSSSDESPEHSSDSDSDDDEGPNEVVFLVYFSLFTIEEFARELLFLLDTVHDITTAPRLSAMDQINYIVRPWKRSNTKRNFLYKQFQKLVPVDPQRLQPPLFPRTQRDERGTLLTPGPEGLSVRARIYQWAWELGARLTEPDMKYAIKTGLAGAMLAAPAFIETTRPIFLEYKGEWALIAFFATMSQSIGQTNFISVYRILGTLLGAAAAVVASTLFPENPVMLPIFGFFFSMPCFYIITQMPTYVQAGRFILLTYNLTCLYTYNLRAVDLSPVTIAIRRSTSVVVGVLWAAIVSRYWWPYTARRELRMGLGDFCLDLSYLYSKLITTYTRGKEMTAPSSEPTSSETSLLLPTGSARHHLDPGVLQFMAMELHLQGQLSELRGLLTHAKREPRLKGPFASDFYNEVLLSCERMLDRLHSMRCVTTRAEWDESIRQAFIIPVNSYQREMAGNIILYFYTLSAGFRLRIPMPPYLPPAEAARERLVDAIRDLDVVRRRSVRAGGRHLLFFAYALAMQEVIAELDFLGSLLQDAFGVISQSTVRDFEELFVGGPEPDVSVHLAHFANDSSSHI